MLGPGCRNSTADVPTSVGTPSSVLSTSARRCASRVWRRGGGARWGSEGVPRGAPHPPTKKGRHAVAVGGGQKRRRGRRSCPRRYRHRRCQTAGPPRLQLLCPCAFSCRGTLLSQDLILFSMGMPGHPPRVRVSKIKHSMPRSAGELI